MTPKSDCVAETEMAATREYSKYNVRMYTAINVLFKASFKGLPKRDATTKTKLDRLFDKTERRLRGPREELSIYSRCNEHSIIRSTIRINNADEA